MKLRNVLIATVACMALGGMAQAQPFGMGQGMMGRNAMAGMGPGMMLGDSDEAYAGLDLSPEQRKKITEIRQQVSQAMWQLMGTMHQQDRRMQGLFEPGALDEQAARKSFQTMNDTQKAMFEMQIQARKRIDDVLTKEQREKLRQSWNGR